MSAATEAINAGATATFRLLLAPLVNTSPWLALIWASALAAVVALLCFRLCSSPARVRRNRDRAVARLLELALFRDDPAAMFGALGRSLAANIRIAFALLPAALVSAPVIVLILIQVHTWLDLRPLHAGESALVTARLAPDRPVTRTPVEARTSPNLAVETPGVRAAVRNEISWRLRAGSPDEPAWIQFDLGDQSLQHAIRLGAPLQPKSTDRGLSTTLRALLHPDQPALAPGSPIESIAVAYPTYVYALAGRDCPWLVLFCVLSLAIAWLLRRPFGVVL